MNKKNKINDEVVEEVPVVELPKVPYMTQHERVVSGRAAKMGITVEEYVAKFPRQK